MKFESKFGIGEVVLTAQRWHGSRLLQDQILVVTGIVFQANNERAYYARTGEGFVHCFGEHELIGDPDFNQETGEYPKCPHGRDKHDCGHCAAEIVRKETGADIEVQHSDDCKHGVFGYCLACAEEDAEHDAFMADQVEPVDSHDDLPERDEKATE